MIKPGQAIGFRSIALVAGIAVLVATAALAWYRSPRRGLPYHDQFAKGRLSEWQQFGGTWSLVDGALHEESDDRGVKLITGSSYWTNYKAQVDLQLLGRGDAGIVIRANDIDEGVDSYSGYYAGLRMDDQSLVLGRADHGWQEFPPTRMPGGVAPNRWYHLSLAAVGCTLQATATALDDGATATTEARDPNCIRSGRVGVRAVASGGIWRNLQVQHLGASALPAPADQPATPKVFYPTDQGLFPRASGVEQVSGFLGSPDSFPADVVPLASVRLLGASRPIHIRVRGTVTITSPGVYIQDATAGAQVVFARPTSLRRGDEIEITGDAHLDHLSLRIENATARTIAGVAPVPALSITPLQAAMGRYDSMFVEVEGRLDSATHPRESIIRLQLSGGQQQFYAISNSREAAARFQQLKQGSILRLRGICLLGTAYTDDKFPFALIVPSSDDVEVLSGPSWWNAEHLAIMAAGMLALGFLIHILYSRADQQRRAAVLEERERLAHEMHDTLAQSFAGLDFKLRAIRNRTRRGPQNIDAKRLCAEVEEACELVRHSHHEARRSLVSLRPEVLEQHGLPDALTQVANRMVGGSSMELSVVITGHPPRQLHVRVADAFFRIGQEAIANAVQHSHAEHLHLKFDYHPSHLTMIIQDDGRGFRPDQQAEGFGLTGMRRRAASINAAMEIESNDAGTRIAVSAPCKAEGFWLFSLSYIRRNGHN